MNFIDSKLANFTRRYNSYGTIILDKHNINDIFNNIKKDNVIVPGDLVYISKYSSYPSLFISRVDNINIRRCLKLEKCTKLIVDESIINNYHNTIVKFDHVPGIINKSYNNDNVEIFSFSPTDNDLENDNIVYYYNAPYDFMDIIINHHDKIVYTENLSNYVNNFLPKLNKQNLVEVTNMIKSEDKETMKLGISIISIHDISNVCVEIFSMFRRYYNLIRRYKLHNCSEFNRICSAYEIDKSLFVAKQNLYFYTKLYKCLNNASIEIKKDLRNKNIEDLEREIRYTYNEYLLNGDLHVKVY